MSIYVYINSMMTAIDIRSKKDLPSDVEKLQDISWNLALSYQALTEKYNKLLRQMYGRSSEKTIDVSQLDALQTEMDALFTQIESQELTQEKHNEQTTIEVTTYKRRRKHPGRNALPEEMITEEIIDVTDAEKACACGREKVIIDRKAHVVVERIPAQYKATRYIRLVYGCSCCKDGVSVAEPVHLPIAKGLAGVNLLLFVTMSKYQYHLPLYRIQRQIFHESGIWFTRSTLASWVRQVAGILERIYLALLEEYQLSRVKHADESPIQVKCEGHYREGWMWVGLTGDYRTAIFMYDNHRSQKAAERLLKGSRSGDYLMVDDYVAYHKPVKEYKLIDMRCMIHIRRMFVTAEKSGGHLDFNKKVLVKIGQLYRIERLANRLKYSSEQRGELRNKYSATIMIQIKALLDNPGFVVLPQSDTGAAINYFLRNWQQANRFLESGDLPIDNSADERIIRPFAIGRNNWMQAGSENGARWMAILYSILTTCKLNGIDAQQYLADALTLLPIRPGNADIRDLMPVNWYKARNNGKLPEVTQLYPSKY
jgi:transposase